MSENDPDNRYRRNVSYHCSAGGPLLGGGKDIVGDARGSAGPVERRDAVVRSPSWLTPAPLYSLISSPVPRALLGWDVARRDIGWVPAGARTTCLEVGSGGGFYTRALGRHLGPAATVIALDPSADGLAAMRATTDRAGWATTVPLAGRAEALPLAPSSVDVVFFGYSLEEVTDPCRAVDEAFRVLRPGGHLVAFLWRPAITARRREPVVARLRERFVGEREQCGPQNIRSRWRRPHQHLAVPTR